MEMAHKESLRGGKTHRRVKKYSKRNLYCIRHDSQQALVCSEARDAPE